MYFVANVNNYNLAGGKAGTNFPVYYTLYVNSRALK
ncbi:hypothetical protein L3N51_01725 [Metallosphaera sp. J1]|nr:hypothetical protein [Metallosphaera javensis (ex Hofmann et al. 2022)]BCS92243.1 MAG: hypothetical protein MjAS7_0851 [Metallosphaera javensis (ex Sakai et al. 2022)]